MIYIAEQLIQIFSAGGRADRGGTRGPRGPKNYRTVLVDEHRAGTIALIAMVKKCPQTTLTTWTKNHEQRLSLMCTCMNLEDVCCSCSCLCNAVQVKYSIEMSGAILALAL